MSAAEYVGFLVQLAITTVMGIFAYITKRQVSKFDEVKAKSDSHGQEIALINAKLETVASQSRAELLQSKLDATNQFVNKEEFLNTINRLHTRVDDIGSSLNELPLEIVKLFKKNLDN